MTAHTTNLPAEELKKRIQWLDWLLTEANTLALHASTIAAQKQRRANLQEQYIRLTTCWCGQGYTHSETIAGGQAELQYCKCNNRDFVITLNR